MVSKLKKKISTINFIIFVFSFFNVNKFTHNFFIIIIICLKLKILIFNVINFRLFCSLLETTRHKEECKKILINFYFLNLLSKLVENKFNSNIQLHKRTFHLNIGLHQYTIILLNYVYVLNYVHITG